MSRASSGLFNVELVDASKFSGRYMRVMTGIADNFVLTEDMPSFLYLKATTARDVLLPAVTQTCDGRLLFIYNEGSGTITLKTSSDAALLPAVAMTGVAAASGYGGSPTIMQAIFGLTATLAWKRLSNS